MLDYDDTFPCDGHMGRSAAIGFLFALGCLCPGGSRAEWDTLGLADRAIFALELSDERLYAGTDDGIYRKDLSPADSPWVPIGLQTRRARALLVLCVGPGMSHSLGLLYYYDLAVYAEYKNEGSRNQIPAGTNPRFIKRSSVLSIIGASAGQIARPDTVDDVLAQVYANQDLFGFEPAQDRAPGFYEGEVMPNAHEFMPFVQGNGDSWWDYNHVQLLWTRRDSLVGSTPAGTGYGMLLRSSNVVSSNNADRFLPAAYVFDMVVSVMPGHGIFFHAWTLISERDTVIPEDQPGAPVRQRNPRFLWADQHSIGPTNANEVVWTSVDQCVDGMWGELQQYPLQWTGADAQIGDRYSTCTLLRIDAGELFRRVVRGTPRERLRCSGSGLGIPFDIDSPFPPFLDSTLPVEFQVVAERAYDQLEWRLGNSVVGRYGTQDGIVDVIKFAVTTRVSDPFPIIVYEASLYCMRGIGIVVQEDLESGFADVTRLRRAMVNGQFCDENFFGYQE